MPLEGSTLPNGCPSMLEGKYYISESSLQHLVLYSQHILRFAFSIIKKLSSGHTHIVGQDGSNRTCRYSIVARVTRAPIHHGRCIVQSIRPRPLVRRQCQAGRGLLHHPYGIRESRIQRSRDRLKNHRITRRPKWRCHICSHITFAWLEGIETVQP